MNDLLERAEQAGAVAAPHARVVDRPTAAGNGLESAC